MGELVGQQPETDEAGTTTKIIPLMDGGEIDLSEAPKRTALDEDWSDRPVGRPRGFDDGS